MKNQIPTTPLKGMSDWFPDEFQIRAYIFSVWRDVCTRFGYQEYLTPLLESADVYKAKSGEDVGGKELMMLTDKAGRELAIRPEMTPSVTRLVSRIYPQAIKPLRYFSIANFIRNEKPQRGRNREFWQLNFDIFGSNSLLADIEIIQMAVEILLAFNPPEGAFEIWVNSRTLVDDILSGILQLTDDQKIQCIRVLDKFLKLPEEEFIIRLQEIGLSEDQIRRLSAFIIAKDLDKIRELFPELANATSLLQIEELLTTLQNRGYDKYVSFSSQVFRGFDYYDGIVFEAYDKSPENRRSMFGGGRYNGLASIFGAESFPAVGCAPGDETTYIFLESWNLIPEIKRKLALQTIYIPLIDEKYESEIATVASSLRKEGLRVECGLEIQSISKAMQYADKTNALYILLLGENEIQENLVTIKNMKTAEQKQISRQELQSAFK